MTSEECSKLLRQARETNTRRDKDEERNGFLPLSKASPGEQLRTGMLAIHAGLKLEDNQIIAEGLAILEDLHALLYGDGQYRLE